MSGPDCEEYHGLISAFVDESLEGPRLLALERHLEACAECRAFEGDFRRFRELLRAAAAFQPPRRPPPGFAAAIVARIEREGRTNAVQFPGSRPPRRSAAAWIGFAAAAAVAVLFFGWSWQRLVPGGAPSPRLASVPVASLAVATAGADEGSMDDWVLRHAALARDATILGHAEEMEFASFSVAAAPGR
jgi:anti-sigma factor RsiW